MAHTTRLGRLFRLLAAASLFSSPTFACEYAVITGPASASIYGAPASFTVTVQGKSAVTYDFDGTPIIRQLRSIELYENGAQVGTQAFPSIVGTGDASFARSSLPAGTYSYTAIARCRLGSATSVPITVYSNALPSVAIAAPASGAMVGTGSAAAPITVRLRATASDVGGSINRVEFYEGGGAFLANGTFTGSDYDLDWSRPNGTFSFYARAVDDLATASSTGASSFRVNAAPSVSTAMSAGESLALTAPGSFTLKSSTSDDVSIARVDYFLVGNPTPIASSTAAPWSAAWGNQKVGAYQVFARATDNDGAASDSAAIILEVNAARGVVPTAVEPWPVTAPMG